MRATFSFLATFILFVSVPSRAESARGDRTAAPYFAVEGAQAGVDALPLKETRFDAEVAGVMALVRLTQVYANEGKVPIQAIYVFPGSTRAAVTGLSMKVGARTITARIEERAAARETYDAANAAGKRAALLEQERPNVFRMSVANILPGDRVEVSLEYSELVVPDGSTYELVIPGVVGPRYSDGSPSNDDGFVASPYLRKGEVSKTAWNLGLRLSSPVGIHSVASPSHKIEPRYLEGKTIAEVSLEDPAAANRDFVLQYWLAGGAIETGLLLEPGKDESFFLLMVQPPARVVAREIPPREYVFVLDVSGSMNGFPLDTAKTLMTELLSSLRSSDVFNIVLFAGRSQVLSEKSVPATAKNIANGIALVDGQLGGGGTELVPALERAFALPTSDAARTVVVVTDGFVSAEPRVFDLIRQRLDGANLFAFGIGSSVNRHLVEGMARAGMGEPFVVLDPAEAVGKASDFRDYISSPVLTDVAVDFGGLDVYDVQPPKVPDLFAARPVVVFGKYRGTPGGSVTVRGRNGAGAFRSDVRLSDARASKATALRYLWARHRVASLEDEDVLREDEKTTKEITRLGLAYGLLTRRTSFVAVDEEVRDGVPKSTTVHQPSPLPEGVSELAVGGQGRSLLMGKKSSYQVTGEARGGGGKGLSIGGMGTKGRGTGASGSGAGKGKVERRAAIGIGGGEETVVQGSLDPALIQAVIERHLTPIKDCYERELLKKPNLRGKLVLQFVIGADGQVSEVKIKSTTLNDAETEACIADRFRKMRFPQPSGGGIVTVNYPLLFSPPGEKE